jgi:hypothetical protein
MLRIDNLDESAHIRSVHCVAEASDLDFNKIERGDANASRNFDNGCAIIAAGGNVRPDQA